MFNKEYWESTFRSWAAPPGKTETQKRDNAVKVIRNAVASSETLKGHTTSVFAQGSYRNGTNVKSESDVDICVCCYDTMFYDIPDGKRLEDYGFSSEQATYEYSQFRQDVEDALVEYLGRTAVKRGNKAFDLHENTYRVDADVVPCFDYWRCSGSSYKHRGTAFIPDGAFRKVVNWPDQNEKNVTEKNRLTAKRYKKLVRILKSLRDELDTKGYQIPKGSSFLIECLVWNVPENRFGHAEYVQDVRDTLAHIFNKTLKAESCQDWVETNRLEYLLRGGQAWTLKEAHNLINSFWEYIGFEE
jgi:hypothetical protein